MATDSDIQVLAALNRLAYGNAWDKLASPRLMKYMRGLNPTQQIAITKTLTPELQATVAHKMIGRQAADVVRRMPNDHGHGSQHVFNVTKRFQTAAQPNVAAGAPGIPLEQRRRGVVGALLHDVGRKYEDPVAARAGMKINKLSPHLWHSESGGRYAKNMIQNNPFSQFLPKSTGTDVRNMIRVHDTDAHKAFPELTKRFLYDKSQLANRTLYAADKADGLGYGGALRTFQTGVGKGETVGESAAFALGKNVPKYERIINEYALPHAKPKLMGELGNYQQAMHSWSNKFPQRAPLDINELRNATRLAS
jgi:hypothetical protein